MRFFKAFLWGAVSGVLTSVLTGVYDAHQKGVSFSSAVRFDDVVVSTLIFGVTYAVVEVFFRFEGKAVKE